MTEPKDVCETTMTPRLQRSACTCNSTVDDMGPCENYELGSSGNCVYCEHTEACHMAAHKCERDPISPYAAKSTRLKAMAIRMQEIIDELTTAAKNSDTAIALKAEQDALNAELGDFLREPCGADRQTPNGGKVRCTRDTAHADEHFDENAGIGWANENEELVKLGPDPIVNELLDTLCETLPVAKSETTLRAFKALADHIDGIRDDLHKAHAILDRVGVPRDRLENRLMLHQRSNLFVDRISKRLHTQVENNMVLFNTIRDAVTLLAGAPGASSYRIKQAIEKLRGALPVKKSPGGIHLQ